ncbi:hypothetical protein VPGG_00036 [Vibrio phage VBM1]|uniref:head maturation protease n=1 Tax=Vibrio phage VBM1 TaxID=754074 RepID=UPI0002C11037|nr:head maturation protease [Vibrio phage VBM1]AGH07353.1 hypothetical protein VPGG_00036 [Vibrio phage VBM1]
MVNILVIEENGRFYVASKEGRKLSEHGYATKEEAEKRLSQIEFFANLQDSSVDESGNKLNLPFLNSSGDFSVLTKNQDGETVTVRFSGNPTSIPSDDKSTPNYWNGLIAGSKDISLKHSVFFDMSTHKIRSVRDGVQEYYGVELGIEPYEKVFTVYRSPETISAVAGKLNGLPITNDHVSADSVKDVKPSDTIGVLATTEIIELDDPDTNSTLGTENEAALDERAIALYNAGKKQFSLGYNGRLKPHDVYDFEQYEFEPTHLALVDSARGGSVLTFVDKKGNNMGVKKLAKVFLDAEGNPNLQQIVEIAQELPEALKKVPVDKLQEMLPMLQEVVSMAGGSSGGDPEMPKDAVSMDKEYEDMEGEEKEKFSDSKLYKSIIKTAQKPFADSKEFKDAVSKATKAHAEVIQKAAPFLDEQYSFADKSTTQIMRDALETEYGKTTFEDSELSTAFKMLKKSDSSLINFGDGAGEGALEARIKQELGGE